MQQGERNKTLSLIERATLLDPLDVPRRLDQLASLEDGWLDGKGMAPRKDGLRWMAKVFDKSFDPALPLPHIYPTPEGGLQAEWNLGRWSVSLEIDLSTREGRYQALNLQRSEDCTERVFDLGETGGWSQLNAALRYLARQDEKAHA